MAYLFSKPSYLATGDPFIQHKPKSSREKGMQFTTNPTKKGKAGKSVFFSDLKYKSDKYIDPSSMERLYQQKRREKMKALKPITEPFKFSSPPQKSAGSGSYFGTIGGVNEHISPGVREAKTRKKEDIIIKPNFVTNPPKKGTYGFVGTTLQKDIYKWEKPNPYDTLREYNNRATKKRKELMVGKEPFRAIGRSRAYFDSHDKVDASKVYSVPEKFLKKESRGQKRKDEEERVREPFKAGSPCRGAFSKYPEYIPDTGKEKKQKKKEEEPKEVFRPTGSTKSGPSRSIIFGSTRGLF